MVNGKSLTLISPSPGDQALGAGQISVAGVMLSNMSSISEIAEAGGLLRNLSRKICICHILM